MRLIVSFSLLFFAGILHASSVQERYKVIGVLGGSSHPVIVLRDNDLVQTFFLKSGEKVPHNSIYIAQVSRDSKVILAAKNTQHVLTFQNTTTVPSAEMKNLVNESDKLMMQNRDLEEYYEKYLRAEGFGIQKDPQDFSKSILEIPGEDISEMVSMEDLLE